MKSIKTLVRDIEKRLTDQSPYPEEAVASFGTNLASKLVERLSRVHDKPSLRMSNLGTPDRKLWYSINRPDLAEPLSASTRLKFLIGDIYEEVILFLAKASGHTVEAEQKEVELHGVKGHIDAVIDGELVDAKSASPAGFRKFAQHGLEQEDSFGYVPQLDGYRTSLASDPVLVNKKEAHFLAGEKVSGKIVLDTYGVQGIDYKELVEHKRKMLESPTPPGRCYPDEPDGESGNRKLRMECSYCPFKSACWPGLRVFLYSKGYRKQPVFLTKVVREPKVPEIKDIQKAWED